MRANEVAPGGICTQRVEARRQKWQPCGICWKSHSHDGDQKLIPPKMGIIGSLFRKILRAGTLLCYTLQEKRNYHQRKRVSY